MSCRICITMKMRARYSGIQSCYLETGVWNRCHDSKRWGIYQIEDASARTGKHVDGNDMLEIIMARDGKVICLWHDCQWERNSGITSILWSKAIGAQCRGQTPD